MAPRRGGKAAARSRVSPPAGPVSEPEHIGVILRCRPLLMREKASGCERSVRRHGEHALEIKSEGAAPINQRRAAVLSLP